MNGALEHFMLQYKIRNGLSICLGQMKLQAKPVRTRMSCGSARSFDILDLYGCRIAQG